jgi:membrane associated rhomboid family serine protease
MSRYAPPSSIGYSFGPGPITFAVKWILIANVAMFVVTSFFPVIIRYLGLVPAAVLERGWIWQLGTYMFLHADVMHILLNMLGVWMFGVTLERRWGTPFFVKYYAVTGLGAGATALLVSLLPFEATSPAYHIPTVGASGALFGLLLAFAIYYPDQPILLMLLFPIPARIFVMIFGGLALLYTIQGGRGVSDAAHLGGLVAGYFYLKGGRGGISAEIKYRYLKWKMNRLRRKFDVYSGGRSDWDRKVH